MFPAGAAGVGLLILRFCGAAMLIRNVLLIATPTLPWWGTVGLLLVVVALSFGVFTPAACIASGCAQIALLIWPARGDHFQLVTSVGVALALLLLGPGAFSVDGRMFGRRRIHLSNSR